MRLGGGMRFSSPYSPPRPAPKGLPSSRAACRRPSRHPCHAGVLPRCRWKCMLDMRRSMMSTRPRSSPRRCWRAPGRRCARRWPNRVGRASAPIRRTGEADIGTALRGTPRVDWVFSLLAYASDRQHIAPRPRPVVVEGGGADQGAHSVVERRLLELLRAEVVRSWSANGDATQAQAILRAMERMREKIELGWAQDFTARLSGLDGLELLVQIAHDLRTPLTSILFLAETLQRGQSGPGSELQRRQTGLIYGAG